MTNPLNMVRDDAGKTGRPPAASCYSGPWWSSKSKNQLLKSYNLINSRLLWSSLVALSLLHHKGSS